MIGITNAINMRTRLNIDSDTLLLITDSIEDKSNYHNTLTNNGVTIQSGTLRDGRPSLYFEYPHVYYIQIDTPNSSLRDMMGPNDWTIEFWLYSTYWYTACAPVAVGYYTTISAGYNAIMFPYYTSGTSVYGGNNGTWNKFSNTSVFPAITNNTWYHYAVVATNGGSTTKFFRNGVLSNTITNTGVAATYSNLANAGSTTIGTYALNYNSTMLLQDIRFSSCARYTTNFTPPERFL